MPPLRRLKVLPNNPRTITQAKLNQLCDSIRENGFYAHKALAVEPIEGKSRESDEAEEQEIIAIEKDCLSRLRTLFPAVPFPQHPNRRSGRCGQRLNDVRL